MIATDIRTMAGALPEPASDQAARASRHNYSSDPLIVYWEMTQACDLACRHCRAEAQAFPQAGELTHAQSKTLLRQIAAFNHPLPHLILTGGDPLKRRDVFALIDEARALGLTVSITPSATATLSREVLSDLKDHGIESIGLSLDGSSAERHEAVRGVDGCFGWTMGAIRNAAELGLRVQINTLVAEETIDDLAAIYSLLEPLPILRWSLFFLIAVGRGKLLRPIGAEAGEECMHWVYELAGRAPFAIKTTEAPSYRRVALERMRAAGLPVREMERTSVYRGFGIRDGHGVAFVSNEGNIHPAGFLPLSAGNVRHDHLVDVYRNSYLFRALHTPKLFKGKCGRCEYGTVCGGSRARAFAATGDPLASDPLCPYEPMH